MKIKPQIFLKTYLDSLLIDHLNINGTLSTSKSDEFLKLYDGQSCVLQKLGVPIEVKITSGDYKDKVLSIKLGEFKTDLFENNDKMVTEIRQADFSNDFKEAYKFLMDHSKLVNSVDYILSKSLKIALDKKPDLILDINFNKNLETINQLKEYKDEVIQGILDNETAYAKKASIKPQIEELKKYYEKVFDEFFNNLQNNYFFKSKQNKLKV